MISKLYSANCYDLLYPQQSFSIMLKDRSAPKNKDFLNLLMQLHNKHCNIDLHYFEHRTTSKHLHVILCDR